MCKRSRFSCGKNFADANQGVSGAAVIPDELMERIREERELHRRGSKSYSWEEVKEMARNKGRRHGLSA
jgi:hypothetical protein